MKLLGSVILGLLLTSTLATQIWAEDGAAQRKAGDPAAGDDVFIKCSGCHQVEENAKNSIGPELNGIIGRRAGSVPNYAYSDALKNSGLVWNEATFRAYVRDAKATVPGTKMNFHGLADEADVSNLIAYLKQFGPDGRRS